jgi:hypothetical protein
VTVPRVNDKLHRPGNQGAQALLLGDLAAVGAKTPKVTEVLPLLYLHGRPAGISRLRSASSRVPQPGCRQR